MRLLEHRRHSRRDPFGVHLAPAGVRLARRVASTIGRFDRVVTSPKPRAVETATAMGFPVDEEVEALERMPDEVEARVDEARPRSFADYAALVRRSGVVAEFARSQSALWEAELARVPEGGRLLLISHGGVIELGAAAAVPQRVDSWGPSVGYLEGVRLTREGNQWTEGEVLRVEV
jgi:broad specificity phosphatase PhoE